MQHWTPTGKLRWLHPWSYAWPWLQMEEANQHGERRWVAVPHHKETEEEYWERKFHDDSGLQTDAGGPLYENWINAKSAENR